jgi:gamma-glutamyl:cysteine ligase YbdK (ATP-grasp superfamily)
VWYWNRPIYDSSGGGHLRIEMRALPAGPTSIDLVANAAFIVGLSLDLASQAGHWLKVIPFEDVHRNFYRAAQNGLEAELVWPGESEAPLRKVRASELIPELIPMAQRGLTHAGVDPDEAEEYLSIISDRCAVGQTGAVWQRKTLAALEERLDRQDALREMLENYLKLSTQNLPVHRWPHAS